MLRPLVDSAGNIGVKVFAVRGRDVEFSAAARLDNYFGQPTDLLLPRISGQLFICQITIRSCLARQHTKRSLKKDCSSGIRGA